jgi:hypothetical protein
MLINSISLARIQVIHIDRTVSVPDARRMLTDEAEYGRWELARTRLYGGGRRTVWLRRKIIRVDATIWTSSAP